jgi:hypothetical protein
MAARFIAARAARLGRRTRSANATALCGQPQMTVAKAVDLMLSNGLNRDIGDGVKTQSES